jgi:hypothetical protein
MKEDQIFPELVPQIKVCPSGEYLRTEMVSFSDVASSFESNTSKFSASIIRIIPHQFPQTSSGLKMREKLALWIQWVFIGNFFFLQRSPT